jgi:hypothetical protein
VSPVTIHTEPFRLRVLKAICTSLEAVPVRDPKTGEPLPGESMLHNVYRGRDGFGDGDPLPLISILEPPLPIDQIVSPPLASGSIGDWDLLIQGFTKDDRENPTDPAHRMMADVKLRLDFEKTRTLPNSAGMPDPFGMGRPQVVNGKAVGNTIKEIIIGPGVVRPPEIAVSDKAYFWLTLTLKISEDIAQPFL